MDRIVSYLPHYLVQTKLYRCLFSYYLTCEKVPHLVYHYFFYDYYFPFLYRYCLNDVSCYYFIYLISCVIHYLMMISIRFGYASFLLVFHPSEGFDNQAHLGQLGYLLPQKILHHLNRQIQPYLQR